MSHTIQPPSRDELLEKYYIVGSTISSLAKEYNTSQPTVRKWLIRYNIERKDHAQASIEANNRKRNNPPSREELLELYKKLSVDHLERRYGVGQSTIYYWLTLYNINTEGRMILTSEKQREIFDTLKERDPEGEWNINDRKLIRPQEVDIVSYKRKIAIEYCGLYWHSEAHKSKTYHLDKLRKVEEHGFRLYTILESDNFGAVINFILPKALTIGARECEIVFDADIRVFEQSYHIMGSCSASINVALMYRGEIVAAMSFMKSRFRKDVEWEIIRYTVGKVSVTGGAEKLFKAFVDAYIPTSIVSYCDRRYGIGNVYNKLGFNCERNSEPNFWYFKKGYSKLLSRQSFQKHKLSKKIAKFDPHISEHANMIENGYLRIYDCGSSVWVWINSKTMQGELNGWTS
jgi:transposase